METINHKETNEKFTKAFMEAFCIGEEQGDKLYLEILDEIFKEIYPNIDGLSHNTEEDFGP